MDLEVLNSRITALLEAVQTLYVQQAALERQRGEVAPDTPEYREIQQERVQAGRDLQASLIDLAALEDKRQRLLAALADQWQQAGQEDEQAAKGKPLADVGRKRYLDRR